MDKLLGETVLRIRGETERARTSLSRVSKVTLGGAPTLRVEDALSTLACSAAAGELTDTDVSGDCSVGEDIIHYKQVTSSYSQ